ncbi:MAG: ASCH domain-containing protein [Candidatus Paceibacterota bacterium]
MDETILALVAAARNIRDVTADKSMKTLKFRHHLAEEIIAGRKTVTWRLFDDKDLKVGDKVELLYWETKEKFADAEIINIREKKLGEIEEKDFEGHEKFESKDKMLETYRKYYGDKVDWNAVVKIIEFKLLRIQE